MTTKKKPLTKKEMDRLQTEAFDDFRDTDLRLCSTLLIKAHYASDADAQQDAREGIADHFAKLMSMAHSCECTRAEVLEGILS